MSRRGRAHRNLGLVCPNPLPWVIVGTGEIGFAVYFFFFLDWGVRETFSSLVDLNGVALISHCLQLPHKTYFFFFIAISGLFGDAKENTRLNLYLLHHHSYVMLDRKTSTASLWKLARQIRPTVTPLLSRPTRATLLVGLRRDMIETHLYLYVRLAHSRR